MNDCSHFNIVHLLKRNHGAGKQPEQSVGVRFLLNISVCDKQMILLDTLSSSM